MLLLVAAASADTMALVPALAMPTATPVASGGGQVALGGLLAAGDTPTASVTLRGTVGITDALAVNVGLREPWGGVLIGVRYLIPLNEHLRIAPFVFGAASDDLLVPTKNPLDTLSAGVGIAVDAGWTNARFDLSLPLVATGVDPLVDPLYTPLMGVSSGVAVALGQGVRVRVALESLASPTVQVAYARERWYVQGSALYSIVHAQPIAAFEAGLRF